MAATIEPATTAAAPAPPSGRCARPSVSRALRRATGYARHRYHDEHFGRAAHEALRRAANDRRLTHALQVRDLAAARSEAQALLVGHLVRLRVVRGARILVDANSTSFDVAGPSQTLKSRSGRVLGRLSVTIQDVIGFVKLVRRHGGGDAVVRGQRGQVRASLSRVPAHLPTAGCATVSGRRYAVSSFAEVSFSGEPLTVWVLVAA
jgi:hypothetical protein